MSKSDDEMIREFLAKKGATKVPEGQSALNYTGKDWAKAVRGENPKPEPKGGYTQSTIIDNRGHEWRVNEHGEPIYIG